MNVKSESEVAQSCATLSDPMDCSPPGCSVHGIFQARVLEWGAIAFSRGSFQPRDRTLGLPHCRQMLYHLSYQGNLDSILKIRDIALVAKIHLVKAVAFPVVIYVCESWIIR